jgi:hypothetical protein
MFSFIFRKSRMAAHYPNEFPSEGQDHYLSDMQDTLFTIQQRIEKIERCYFDPCVIIISGFDEMLECYNPVDDNNHWKLHIYTLFHYTNIPPFYIINMWKEYDSTNIVIQLVSHNVKKYVFKILNNFFMLASPNLITTIMQH